MFCFLVSLFFPFFFSFFIWVSANSVSCSYCLYLWMEKQGKHFCTNSVALCSIFILGLYKGTDYCQRLVTCQALSLRPVKWSKECRWKRKLLNKESCFWSNIIIYSSDQSLPFHCFMPSGAIGGQAVLKWVYLSHFLNEENESNLLEEAKQAWGTARMWNTRGKQNPRWEEKGEALRELQPPFPTLWREIPVSVKGNSNMTAQHTCLYLLTYRQPQHCPTGAPASP